MGMQDPTARHMPMHAGMMKPDDFMDPSQQLPQQPGLALDTGVPFEPMGIDPMPFDYSSQLMPSMDSPNFNLDYNQQVRLHPVTHWGLDKIVAMKIRSWFEIGLRPLPF